MNAQAEPFTIADVVQDDSGIVMSDLARYATTARLQNVAVEPGGVTLRWDDGFESHLPAIWLRDNCPCARCRHPQALERTYLFIDDPDSPVVLDAIIGPESALVVQFASRDGVHESRFTRGWLRAHDAAALTGQARRLQRVPWGHSIRERLATIDHQAFIKTAPGLRAWLEAVAVDGIARLTGTPQVPGAIRDVAARIGPVRATNFGEFYDVISLPRPNASAYTSIGLELHTDLANWRSPPDVQLLCCVKSTVVGGDSVFADGLMIAERLRQTDPAAFDVLTSQPFEFRFHDEHCDIRHAAPVIELDASGEVEGIRFNNWLRQPLIASAAAIEASYAALAAFWRMLRDPEYRLELRLEPGQLIAYDNRRILHGRTAFDPSTGERHLQGCYLNRDDVDSALRLLDRRPG
jgi:gamma-butyrobetaine dioxygenase